MDEFLEKVEKHKFAILGTALLHVIAFFYMNFATVDHSYSSGDTAAEVILPLDDILLDPELMKLLDINKKPEESEEVANLAVDGNDQREKSYENFSTQEMDEQVENDAKNLEKEFQEYWEGTHPDDESNSIDLEEKDEKDTHKNDRETNEPSGENAYAGSVMVSYNLKDRKKHKLPRPGYTCNSSGTVVIDIKVDKSGEVKSATFNSALSAGADQCMINKAIKYAKKSSFNYSGTASGSQSGTITYKFVSK
jgi:hypothetical protein